MILSGQNLRIVVAVKPVDFRKGHDGLAAVVQSELGLDPHSGIIVVFRSKRADRIKVMTWDGSGLVLACKRLEQGSFAWSPIRDGVMKLSAAQFGALFEGRDGSEIALRSPIERWRKVRAVNVRRPHLVE
jgi:transposase